MTSQRSRQVQVSGSSLQRAAAQELLRRRQARRSIESFAAYVNPVYQVNWHHRVLCQYLDRFATGEIRRLMVFMPPQHGKSELVSRLLPAFLFGCDPDAKVIAASYAAELIQGMNRDVQRVMEGDRYRALFPATELNSKNIRTVSGSWLRNNDIFEVIGRRGQYRCAGVGGGLTGFPADIALIDDPYKDYREAVSPTVRRAVFEWYTSTLLSRTHNDSRICLTVTRWHHEDLAGELLRREGDRWVVVRLPALCEDPDAPDEQRALGEALWPERFNQENLLEKKRLNPFQFEALYQQNPRPREGGMFKRSWFEVVGAVPAGARYVRAWDKAATEGAGDWTVGVLMAYSAGITYICDVVRGRWDSGERDRIIRQTAVIDAERYQDYCIDGPQDPGQAGKVDAAAFVKLLNGFSVHVSPESGSKELRADPVASQASAGNVKLVAGGWVEEYIEEFAQFPDGADDQVDATSRGFRRLALGEPEPDIYYVNV